MIRSLLVRGLLVGLLAGVLAFAVAYLLGEPQVQAAIDFEEAMAANTGQAELVGRGVQRTVGLLTGTVVLGVAFGGLFSMAFAYAYGRIAVAGARPTAALLALAAYVTITLVPSLKYPANPPSVGSPATIDQRTLLAFAAIAVTALSLGAAARVRAGLLPRLGSWNATLSAGGVFVVVVALAGVILPSTHETPTGFPADVLYDFRMASLAINATMWVAIGLGFGAAADRLLGRTGAARARAAA